MVSLNRRSVGFFYIDKRLKKGVDENEKRKAQSCVEDTFLYNVSVI